MVRRGAAEEELKIDDRAKMVLNVVRRISAEGEATVGEVVKRASSELGLPAHEIAKALFKLRELEVLAILDPSPPRSFARYVLSSRSAWFWAVTLTVLVTDLLVLLSPATVPAKYARYVLGSVFVLYLPGAVLIELLYPKHEDLSQLERLALSIGLSLALVPLVGLVLNYTPWGIRLAPVVIALTALTMCFAIAAARRKYSYHLLAHVRPG